MKKSTILEAVLAMVLVVAVAALAAPASAQDERPIKGVLEELGPVLDGGPVPTHTILDEENGRAHQLFSRSVDLEPYVGERVLVYGGGVWVPREQRPRGTPPPVDVTRIYSLGDSGETVEVTFELKIEGEVPEENGFSLTLGPPPGPSVFFCTTTRGKYHAPRGFDLCEGDGTRSGDLELPVGQLVSFEYVRSEYDAGSGERTFETFYSDSRTFAEDDTVSVTYAAAPEYNGPSDSSYSTPALPESGGVALLKIGVGALLLAAGAGVGFLVRRIAR